MEGMLKSLAKRGETNITIFIDILLCCFEMQQVDDSKIPGGLLSGKETEILNMVAQGAGNEEIANKLFVFPNTVKTHLSNIYIKLGVHSRTKAVSKAEGLNMITFPCPKLRFFILIGDVNKFFGLYNRIFIKCNQFSGSFGITSACSVIPGIILMPIGGIIADRVNKRNVMVILDFSTAMLMFLFLIMMGRVNLVTLLIVTLMILYGIQGTYQPAVQASIPVLASEKNLLGANAVINQVSTLSDILGSVLGGVLYGVRGIQSILS